MLRERRFSEHSSSRPPAHACRCSSLASPSHGYCLIKRMRVRRKSRLVSDQFGTFLHFDFSNAIDRRLCVVSFGKVVPIEEFGRILRSGRCRRFGLLHQPQPSNHSLAVRFDLCRRYLPTPIHLSTLLSIHDNSACGIVRLVLFP